MKTSVLTQPAESGEASFHVVELDDVADAVRLAAKVEYGGLPGGVLADSAVRVAELKAQLAALEAEIVAAYDASGDWAGAGYRSVGAALSHRTRIRRGEVNQTVALARSLKAAPVVSEALHSGDINVCHARRLARASARDGFADAEQLLCGHACTLSYAAFDKAVSYWEHLVDADAAEHDAVFKEQHREFHASLTFDGMGRLDGWLDPIGFEEFRNALSRIETELFHNDVKHAQDEHIDKQAVELWRTPAQRRADALVEMARRATATPKDAKAPEPLVIIHMDKPAFETGLDDTLGLNLCNNQPTNTERSVTDQNRLCETDNGAVITPTQAVEQAIRGHIRRLVYETPGVILDYGRSTRLFTGALRQAIQARDRTCRHPGCDQPARLCEIDHITEWQHGGTTTHTNADTRCSYHHRHHKPPI